MDDPLHKTNFVIAIELWKNTYTSVVTFIRTPNMYYESVAAGNYSLSPSFFIKREKTSFPNCRLLYVLTCNVSISTHPKFLQPLSWYSQT